MLSLMSRIRSHTIRLAIACGWLALAFLPGSADAQPASTSQLTVFIQGTRLGELESTVQRTSEGWTISSTGRLSPPLDVVTRRMVITYGPDWTPLGVDIDAVTRGVATTIRTTVSGTTATSEVTERGQTIPKTDTISPRALLLPNLYFASFEALALQLSAMTGDSARFPAYIAPQAEIQVNATRLESETIQTTQTSLRVRRFAVTFANPGRPLASEVWIDDTGRLLRFSVVAQGLIIVRDDLSSVSTRRLNITRAGDETVHLPGNGFNLAGTLSKPAGNPDAKGRYPAVIMVAGSGVTDRDETVAGIPIFGSIAGQLADAGHLVVRYDKRGVGQSGGRQESATLADYADDVLAVFKFLSKRKDVDDRRIALVGHSEGTWVALTAASREKQIAALVLANAPSGPGSELVLEQQQTLLAKSSLSDEEKQARVALQRRVQAAVLGQGDWTDVPEDARRQADTPWFRSFLMFEPASVMRRVRQPILIVQGELDKQVLPHHADKLADLARARKKAPAGAVTVVKLPGINHLLVPAQTGDVGEYASLSDRQVSPEVASAVVAFLKERWHPDESRRRGGAGRYSYRNDSIGSSREARIAGSRPLTRPTTTRMPVHTTSSSNDSTMWMSSCLVASSSNSERNGRGLNSHTSTYDSSTPIAPPAKLVATPSSRNCSRMWRRRAPRALRMPISRVRSCTETNMMFITPTPPMPSVRMPMKPSTSFSPVVMPLVISFALADPNARSARSSFGLKPRRLASSSRT